MKRRNGEGSWGTKTVGNNKYHYFRDSSGHYTYGKTVKVGEVKNEIPINTTAFVKVPIESQVAVKKKNIPFLSEDDAELLYNTLKIRYKNGDFKYKENAHALILIMYSGMRISEMTSLRWKNVDIENKRIFIR